MMKNKSKWAILAHWITLFSIPLIAILIIFILSSNQTKAFSGVGEVAELDLFYIPGSKNIEVRVHLTSGLALTHETQNEEDIRMLFDIAKVFSKGRTRLMVELEKDKIKRFQISVFSGLSVH